MGLSCLRSTLPTSWDSSVPSSSVREVHFQPDLFLRSKSMGPFARPSSVWRFNWGKWNRGRFISSIESSQASNCCPSYLNYPSPTLFPSLEIMISQLYSPWRHSHSAPAFFSSAFLIINQGLPIIVDVFAVLQSLRGNSVYFLPWGPSFLPSSSLVSIHVLFPSSICASAYQVWSYTDAGFGTNPFVRREEEQVVIIHCNSN